MEWTAKDELMAQAIAYEAVKHLKQDGSLERISQAAETKAMEALEKIRRVLDDVTIEDLECFRRIEAIVQVFEVSGIFTTRHDW